MSHVFSFFYTTVKYTDLNDDEKAIYKTGYMDGEQASLFSIGADIMDRLIEKKGIDEDFVEWRCIRRVNNLRHTYFENIYEKIDIDLLKNSARVFKFSTDEEKQEILKEKQKLLDEYEKSKGEK